MAVASAPELRLLMALRLSSVASAADLAQRADVDGDVDVALDDLVERGLVRHRDGLMVGWSLTPSGRSEGEAQAARELDEAGVRAEVERSYERFLELNADLLEVCTDWQLVDLDGGRRPNEHDDAAYDAAVVARLRRLHDRARPAVEELAELLDRFSAYPERLGSALSRVEAGEADWFTKPTIDSYHTVWFELHEHLLATLGLERASS